MRKNPYVICGVMVLSLLVATGVIAGQQAAVPATQSPFYQGPTPGTVPPATPAAQGRGAPPPAAAPAGVSAQATGPLSLILGPVGDVRQTNWGNAKAPTTDSYYLVEPPEEWMPDEFQSNPDREFDWHNLKGWHFVPNIKKVTLIGNRKVKPGDSVQFEGIVEDITGTQNRVGFSYYGPKGRRTTLRVQLRPVTPGSNVMRGSLLIEPWVEPGFYRATEFTAENDTRHSKAFWPDFHPGLQGLDFEVAANPNADVIPPTVEWIKLNKIDAPMGQIRTQRVQDPIPIYAKITDNKSGVEKVTIRLETPGGHFIESALNKVVGHPDVYGAVLSVPKWWEGGEYKVMSMWVDDRAHQENMLMASTSPVLRGAKIITTQDPEMIDKTPPELFSVWVEKTSARLGEPVRVNAIITDDKSGVGTIAVMFSPRPSYIDRVRVHLKPVEPASVVQKSGLDINANLWTGTLDTSPWLEPGEWAIDRITARDNADNYLDLLPEYTPEIADVKINYTGGVNLREQLSNQKKGIATPIATGPAPAAAPAAAAAARPAGGAMTNEVTLPNGKVVQVQPGAAPDPVTGKIRRVDMIPPHPPRGACLNCHEPLL